MTIKQGRIDVHHHISPPVYSEAIYQHGLEAHAGAQLPQWSVQKSLDVMDVNGIWAQIVYPNILGFGGQASAKVDPELRLITTQIYNDAMAEIQEESGQRLFPMALLPWW